MDAGDFSEGHIYYLADRGRTTFQIHGSVGFDVSVIGNHDYLMGAKDLDVILRDVNMSFELLGANFHTSPKYVNIKEKMKPYWETEIDGVKIGVLDSRQMTSFTNGELVMVIYQTSIRPLKSMQRNLEKEGTILSLL